MAAVWALTVLFSPVTRLCDVFHHKKLETQSLPSGSHGAGGHTHEEPGPGRAVCQVLGWG